MRFTELAFNFRVVLYLENYVGAAVFPD